MFKNQQLEKVERMNEILRKYDLQLPSGSEEVTKLFKSMVLRRVDHLLAKAAEYIPDNTEKARETLEDAKKVLKLYQEILKK